jgi:hypothetical protein
MPPRGKIKSLTPALRAEFERRLVEGSFSDYRGLTRWLGEHGCQLHHSSVNRYGHGLERRLDALKLATEQARAVVDAAGGADDTVNEGLMRLVQGDLFRVLVELREVDSKKIDINALARNVASICRSSVQMRRAAEEMRNGIGRRVLAAERKVVAAARRGARGGLSEGAEKRIRAALLEIAELPAPDGSESALAMAHPPIGGDHPERAATARPQGAAVETAETRSDAESKDPDRSGK